MYQFILNMWVRGFYTEDNINYLCDTKHYITKEESDMILATPKLNG